MKKIFCLCLMAMALVACSSSSDDEKSFDVSQIYGTWKCVEATYRTYDGAAGIDETVLGATISIKSDGTFTADGYWLGSGTWKHESGNNFSVVANDISYTDYKFNVSVDGNIMTMNGVYKFGTLKYKLIKKS